MSFRRWSNDFTASLIEYNRAQDEKDMDSNDSYEQNNKLEPVKKNLAKVKSNETIVADTTIYNQVCALRTQLKSQQQIYDENLISLKTPETFNTSEISVSPITDVLNKISKTLELNKDVKATSKPKVEACLQEPSKLWNALSSYNRSLNADKNGVQSHQKVLNRLSQEFHLSPAKFAEKLVTIIEESIVPSISDHKDCSAVSVRRMTQEFRKLCKFIEDESMPECLLSSDTVHEEQIENQTIEFADVTLGESKTYASTPLEKTELIKISENSYKETPKSIFKTGDVPLHSKKEPFNKMIKDCRFNDTNNSFEYWETMCNGVFLPQRNTPQKLRRSLSLPDSPVRRLNNIKSTCERQMASLDDTVLIDSRIVKNRNFREFLTCSPQKLISEESKVNKYFPEQSKKTKEIKRTNEMKEAKEMKGMKEIKEMKGTKEIKGTKVSSKKETPVLSPIKSNDFSLNCEDDLDKSLLAELAQRRQRCFETAKLMMEIDKNDPTVCNSSGKQTTELLAKLGSPNKSLTLPANNLDFLNTINHCMEYQDFLLKKRKSIFNILKNPTPDSKERKTAESPKTETPLSSVKKSSASKVKSAEVKKAPRRRFFTTPGKSPKDEELKKKKEYFPQMENIISVQSTVNIAKSPRTPDFRKNLYDYVRSPVAEYIKSTDTKLVKHIQGKNNDWLLTPQPLGVSNESKGNRLTPMKHLQESAGLKFNLSPMSKKDLDLRPLQDENTPKREFNLPEVAYKSSKNQLMNEENSENDAKNSRVKNLLKSSEKKIVIRHEGRMGVGSSRKKDKEGSEVVLDTSVLVKTIARKTDSIRTRNVR